MQSNYFPKQVTKVAASSNAQPQFGHNKKKEFQPTSKTKSDKSMQSQQKTQKDHIQLIIRFLRKLIQQKNLQKRHRYRLCVLQELYKTEQRYVEDLSLIIMVHSVSAQWVPKQKLDIIFGNVKQIYKLNQDFLKEIQEKLFKTKDPNQVKLPLKIKQYDKIADVLKKYGPFFKIYFQYISEFENSQKHLEKLYKEYPDFKNYCLQEMVKSKEFSHLDIESYLIKPIQRLPKYVMLLNDYIKQTDVLHPDYEELKQALAIFSKVNEENNFFLNKNMMNKRLFDIQKQFPNIEVINSKRNFVKEYVKTIFWKNKQKEVIVYILSDMIIAAERNIGNITNIISSIVVDESQYKLLLNFQLDEQSECLPLEDSQYFKNMWMIKGQNGTITFIEQGPDEIQKNIQEIRYIIDDLVKIYNDRQSAMRKNNLQTASKHPIFVQVIGVEERKQTISSHKVYIAEVQIGEVFQKVFLRFSECVKLSDDIKKAYPNCNLNYIKHTNLNFLQQEDKEIEGRMIQLTNFLSSLLQQPFMKENKQFLKQIGLPENFYELPNLLTDEVRGKLPRNRSVKGDRLEYKSPSRIHLKVNSTSNIDTPTSQFLSKRYSATQLIKQESQKPIKEEKNQTTITIFHNNPQEKPLNMLISSTTRADDICEDIKQKFGLQSISDFRLFTVDSKQRLRPLEGDEIIANLFGLGSIFSFGKKELFFRKYIYLDYQEEIKDYYHDLIKLKMVYNQLVTDVAQAVYFFNFEEYCELAALYFYISCKQVSYDQLSGLIPSGVLKTEKKEIWILKINQYLQKSQSNQSTAISIIEEVEKGDQQPTNNQFGMLKFIEKLFSNQCFGLQMFQVVCKDNQKKYGDCNILLAIGYKGVSIYETKRKRKLEDLEIKDIKVFPGAIHLTYGFDQIMKLETTQGFQIHSLFDEYRIQRMEIDEEQQNL